MSPLSVKCPTCGREIEWATAAFRPFCSERCRLVDLGAWFSEQRAIAAESGATPADEAAEDPAPAKDPAS